MIFIFNLWLILELPYLIPFSGLFYLGIVLFNLGSLPLWAAILIPVWSLNCFYKVPKIKEDIDYQIALDNGLTFVTIAARSLLSVLQYPTFITAMYILWIN
tara:strand:+ start:88 stop:390 length:303 start_codon:yes stop_codon:yes gene_type:complete